MVLALLPSVPIQICTGLYPGTGVMIMMEISTGKMNC
jgi:hypothetical protein